MPEDKRKMLQALAAKRKADNEAGGRKKPKEAAAVGVVTGKKDSVKVVGGGKVHQKTSPVSKGKEMAKGKPKKKVVKLDSDSDTSEEEEDVSGESEEEDVGDSENSDDSDGPRKKLVSKPVGKPPSAKKGKAVLPVSKGKDLKGKGKDLKGKGKKTADSDDSGAENGLEDDDSDLSEDPLDEVNPDNILPSRTRRRTAQPVNYDFSAGDLDEDDDSDED